MAPTPRFPVGYHDQLHPDRSINFQMNRWINYLGEDALNEMRRIGPRLSDIASYRREFMALAEDAFSMGRALPAAYYSRAAEFFMRTDDPLKLPTRKRFVDLVCQGLGVHDRDRVSIPYMDGDVHGQIPAYYFPHANPKGTIVIHGGFDSYIEELFPLVMYLRDSAFSVVCFEGPGQGAALLESGLLMTHEWHKPVKVVLDHFGLTGVSLLGLSMGGCLALRAAAAEPRVERVIACDVFMDWTDTTMDKLGPIAPLLSVLLNARAAGVFNAVLAAVMQRSPLFEWGMHQARLVLGASDSFEVFRTSRDYTTRDISSNVRQDVLILAGAEDHAIPLRHFHEQLRILTKARSVTGRLFTRAEHAQNHCQVGNLRLVVDFIADWIDFASRHSV